MTRPRNTRRAVALALLAASSAAVARPALAQGDAPASPAPVEPTQTSSAPAPSPEPEPIEVVVTGSRTPESSQRSTVRTRVVTREEAERRGATNVGEALQGELGVQVNPSSYGALGSPSAIQIQGFDRDRVLVLEDGERVIGDTGGAIDLSSLPLTDVTRIELVTGPTSSLYGTSAIGGVVNVITSPPWREGASGRVRLEGQSYWGGLVQGSGAYRGGDHWVGAEASGQARQGVALDETRDVLTSPSRSQRLLGLRGGTRLGDVELFARARWIHDTEEGREEQDVPVLGTYVIDLPAEVDRVTLHVGETLHLGGGSSLRFIAGRQWAYRTSERDRRDSPVDEIRSREGVMQSLESVAVIADGDARTWVFGARAEVESLEQDLSRTEALPTGLESADIVEVPVTKLGSGALYGQLSYAITDWLTVMPGVRGELHLRYGGVVAPRLATAIRPVDELTLRLSAGRGFRAPSAKEIGFSFDHSYLGYRVAGNPDLVPESSWGINGDVTVKPSDRVTLRAGAFVNWIDDLIDIDITPVDSTGGVDTFAYRNIGKARTSGAELQAQLQAASWLRTETGYAYLWTRDDTNERPLEGRPPHTVHAAVLAELPAALELVLRYRVVTDAFLDEDLRAPGFSTFDARLARLLWPAAQVYVGAKNLFDIRKDSTRLGDQRPVDGRVVYLGVTAELPPE